MAIDYKNLKKNWFIEFSMAPMNSHFCFANCFCFVFVFFQLLFEIERKLKKTNEHYFLVFFITETQF